MNDDPEGGGCGGIVVLTAAALGVGAAVYAVSRDVFVIVFWTVGALLLWRAARKGPKIDNPSPGRGSERGPQQEPQVSFIRDTSHPNRWVALRPSIWLDWTDEKTGTSS